MCIASYLSSCHTSCAPLSSRSSITHCPPALSSLVSRCSTINPPFPSHMDEGCNNKQKRMTKPTARDFLLVGKDIQNKVGRPIGSAETEDCHFREFLGAGPFTVANLWNMMVDCESPSGRRDQASSLDALLSKCVSEASGCVLESWGVNWCD